MQARHGEVEQAMALAREQAEHEGLLAKMIAPGARLLLDQAGPHQRQQQAPDGRLVQPALPNDLAEGQAGGALTADERQQSQGAVDALRA